MNKMIFLVKFLFWIGGIVRKVNWKRPLRQVRGRVTKGTLRPLHVSYFHEYRNLSVAISQSNDYEQIAEHISSICTASNYVMADLLELDPFFDLHCSLKVFVKGSDEEDKVVTWGRSLPPDAREPEIGLDGAHSVKNNTVWCALLGRDDGGSRWQPFNCFCSNDLTAHGSKFKCDRVSWADYYKSTLVFPIKCAHNTVESEVEKVIGFLAFDSSKPNAFEGLPSTFDYISEWSDYHKLLGETAPFHLGAIMVHALGEAFRPVHWEKRND